MNMIEQIQIAFSNPEFFNTPLGASIALFSVLVLVSLIDITTNWKRIKKHGWLSTIHNFCFMGFLFAFFLSVHITYYLGFYFISFIIALLFLSVPTLGIYYHVRKYLPKEGVILMSRPFLIKIPGGDEENG